MNKKDITNISMTEKAKGDETALLEEELLLGEKLQQAEEIYHNIEIPAQLNQRLNNIFTEKRKNNSFKEAIPMNKTKNFFSRHYLLSAAALALVVFTGSLNIYPPMADALSDIPLIGQIAQVLTFREYDIQNDIVNIQGVVPSVGNMEDKDFEKKINKEIHDKIDIIVAEAQERGKEYKEAFLETGGKIEEYHPVTIDVNYEVKHSSPNLLSFTVEKTETLANAYTEMYFYNLDLNKSRQLTLEDVLGKDYKQIVDNSVAKQIAERKKDENNVFFEKEEGGFTGINKDQNFIVNQEGQVVIVFNKYEIAPGCMGIQEFPINAPLMIDAK